MNSKEQRRRHKKNIVLPENTALKRSLPLLSNWKRFKRYNDLQNHNVSEEVSVAEVIGLFSALANRPVMPSLVICGRVVMSGSMLPITAELEDIFVAASNAGAKKIMLPFDCKRKYESIAKDLKKEIEVIFYKTPLDAAKKALSVDGFFS